MLRKGKEHVELQGQQALQLISSAAQPAKAASGHLGTNLNVLA